MWLWLSLGLLLAAPTAFEDTQQRFVIDLPAGWRFSPMPGDTAGAVFTAAVDGLGAVASVRVFALDQPVALAGAARDSLVIVSREPNFRLLTEEPCTLGGLAGVRRRYVHAVGDGSPRMKMVEDRLATYRQTIYLVRVEALAEAFAPFEADAVTLFASFRPRGVVPEPDSPGLIASPIIGRWALDGDATTIFELRSDGTFSLAGASGEFRLDGATLVTKAQGDGEEAFAFVVQGDRLTLSSPALGEPLGYTRVRAKVESPPAKAGKGKARKAGKPQP